MSEPPITRCDVLDHWRDALVRGDAAEVDRLVHQSRVEHAPDDHTQHIQNTRPMTASTEEDR